MAKIPRQSSLITRIITMYVPNKSSKWGDRKIYCQQQKKLTTLNITTCPLKIFWKDVWKLLYTCQNITDKLFLVEDWNHDIRDEKNLYQFKVRSLKPLIIQKYRNLGPGIYQRGNSPIDEICISFTIKSKLQRTLNMVI